MWTRKKLAIIINASSHNRAGGLKEVSMATLVENLKIELLTQALYETGNGHKVQEINEKILNYISKGKFTKGDAKQEK